jgi:uncharacterized protein
MPRPDQEKANHTKAEDAPTEVWPPDAWMTEGPDGSVALIGGYSPSSGRHHFPPAAICPYSGADDVETVTLSGRGALWAWTSVTAAPPGYEGPVPYGFGVVELADEGLRVIGRLTEADPGALTFGQPMHVVVEELAGGQRVWAFAPIGTAP